MQLHSFNGACVGLIMMLAVPGGAQAAVSVAQLTQSSGSLWVPQISVQRVPQASPARPAEAGAPQAAPAARIVREVVYDFDRQAGAGQDAKGAPIALPTVREGIRILWRE